MDTVAEGVETRVQALFLAAQGCRLAQGRFFGDPVPADELTEALRFSSSRLKRRPFGPMNVLMEPQRSLKVLLADVPEPDAIEIAAALESAGWTVHARRTTGGDGLEAALIDRGWEAVLFGGEGAGGGAGPQGARARAARRPPPARSSPSPAPCAAATSPRWSRASRPGSPSRRARARSPRSCSAS
jgi:hypothetical protein